MTDLSLSDPGLFAEQEQALPRSGRRERRRRKAFKFDKQEVAARVIRFFDQDDQDRAIEKEARLQRYAKYRMWIEDKTWPWPAASNVPLPDIQEKCLHTHDTLINALMAARPPIGSKALNKINEAKESKIDRLIDFQIFDEQPGENTFGDIVDAFVNDGVFVVFIPWITEMRETSDVRTFEAIPDDQFPAAYFQGLVGRAFPNVDPRTLRSTDEEGWDYRFDPGDGGDEAEVSFYTKGNGDVEMVTRRRVMVYDGPRIIQKEWDEVLYPAQAANLHIPGPSNPHGAGHVILVDRPSIDEIVRLW